MIAQYHLSLRNFVIAFVTSVLTALSRLLGAFLYKQISKCCIIWKLKFIQEMHTLRSRRRLMYWAELQGRAREGNASPSRPRNFALQALKGD